MDDLVGRRFGRWTALSESPRRGKNRYFLCACDCGTRRDVAITGLLQCSKSCGCLKRELAAEQGRKMLTTHGGSKTREWITWNSIKARCFDPDNKSFHQYGGRGITMCREWAESFPAFFAAVGPRPSPRHSIERIDNSRGYEPGNCRWATPKEQARNRRTNRAVTLNGVTRTIAEWAEVTGIPATRIWARLRAGHTPERVLSAEDHRRPVMLTLDGETHTLHEWATLRRIKAGTIHARLKLGWPIERVLS